MHGKVLKSQKKCSLFAYRGQGTIFLKKANRESRAICPFFGTTFGRSGSGRDPVGIQSGSSRDPVGHQFWNFSHRFWTCREAAKITLKRAKTLQKCSFLRFWLLPDSGARLLPTGSRLDPDWIPTGSRLAKSGAKTWKIGARLGAGSVPVCFFQKKLFPGPYF